MNINWFPGHMKKTEGLIKDNLKLVDIVIELVDARIPLASKNPLIDGLIKDKPRLLVFNKSDMADDSVTNDWINYYRKEGCYFTEYDEERIKQLFLAATEAGKPYVTLKCSNQEIYDKIYSELLENQ